MSLRGEAMTAVSEGGESVDMDTEEDASHTTEPKEERDDLINPFWIEDRDLGRGEVDYLSGPEIQFWKDLIDKYLHPIDSDKAKQVIQINVYEPVGWGVITGRYNTRLVRAWLLNLTFPA